MKTFPLTLMVLTRNEAHNIARCLNSVPFAAEKVVIDAGSDDATCEIALQHGARVIEQEWLGFGKQRNFASGCAGHDWILVLDADEALTEPGVQEFCERLPRILDSDLAGAILRRSAYYMGAPMNWYRPMVGEKLGRLYHRDRARWTDALVHESLVFQGEVANLNVPFMHHHSPTLVHKQIKVLMYSELWALQKIQKGRKPAPLAWPLVYLSAFFKDYVLRRAAFDGWRGLVVAHIAASYAVYKRVRHCEMMINPESIEGAREALRRHGMQVQADGHGS